MTPKASRRRPTPRASSRATFHGGTAPVPAADEDAERSASLGDDDDDALAAAFFAEDGARTPSEEKGEVILRGSAEPDDTLYTRVLEECVDTIGMLARHRAERPMRELRQNEEQLLAQVDAIAECGGDVVVDLLAWWETSLEADDPWKTWGAVFALAALEGRDVVDAIALGLSRLGTDESAHAAAAAEALTLAPHPEVATFARTLMRGAHPISRAVGVEVIGRRGQLSPSEARELFNDPSVIVVRAALRVLDRLPPDAGVALAAPFVGHPDREVAWSASRLLSIRGRPDAYFEVREGRGLAKTLGVRALELLIHHGDAADAERFDEIVLATSFSARHLSAIARFGYPSSWELLAHHLAVPELRDAAAEALATLFGPRLSSGEADSASAWRDVIGRGSFDASLRYRRGEPWSPKTVVAECRGARIGREELGLRLDELAARTGIGMDVDLSAWSVDLEAPLGAAMGRAERATSTPGGWQRAYATVSALPPAKPRPDAHAPPVAPAAPPMAVAAPDVSPVSGRGVPRDASGHGRGLGPTGTFVLEEGQASEQGPTGTIVLPPDEAPAPAGTMVVAGGDEFPAAEGGVPSHLPVLTLAQYAEVMAHVMFGGGSRAVFAKYGLEDSRVRRQVLDAWAARIKQNPHEEREWSALYAAALSRM